MANVYTGTYKRFNGTDWDTIYFHAPATAISETTNRKWLTATQQTDINNYLVTFNAANKLLKLDSQGKIPSAQIPFTIGDYLKRSGGTMTGNLNMGTNTLSVDKITGVTSIGSSAGPITIGTPDEIIFQAGDGQINMGGAVLEQVGTPEYPHHAATRGYVDQLIATGTRSVEAVKAATTSNVTTSDLGKIDGYQLVANDRVLVKNQTTASENGIYIAKTGSWTKVSEDSGIGSLVFVEHGTVNNDSTWMIKEENVWLKFSQVDLFIIGEGLTKSGNTVKLANQEIKNIHIANNAAIAVSKLENFASYDQVPNSGLNSADTSASISRHIQNLYSAIANVKGTSNYNTDNGQSLSWAYVNIAKKNRTYKGTAAPSNSGYVDGDIYIHHD